MLITVFTPTYNRAHLLPRLYESLAQQTKKDFEWLIIDDGSVDNTKEVITEFQNKNNGFPIMFFEQEHGGKHRAINKAVRMACGKYFFIVDSDDWLLGDTIETVTNWIQESGENPALCAVAGQKVFSDMGMVGTSFEGKEFIDSTFIERKSLNITGDKAEVFLTSILKEHPFPEFENEYFISEGVVWDAICADGYKVRWYNKPIYVCEYLEDGLSKSGANDLIGHMQNFKGYSCLIRQCLKLKGKLGSYRDFVEFERTCDALKLSVHKRADALEWSNAQYLFYRFMMIPAIHNVKRIIFVTRKVKEILTRKKRILF